MKWLVRTTVAAAALALAAAFWLLETESGLRWALGYAPRELAVEGLRGALAREIAAERVAWQGIEARKVSFQLNLFALLADTVSVNFLRIESLTIRHDFSSPSAQRPAALPVRIKLSDAEVKSLVFEGYELNELRLDYAGGPLGHELAASFLAAGARAKIKAGLDARARPTRLAAEVEALNLAVIDPALPQTALRVRLEARGDEKAASGQVAVENPQAGPLDAERLPLASAQAAFSTDFASVSLSGLAASVKGSGTLEGSGALGRDGARFDLRVRELDLRALRSNLARTRLAGTLAVAAGAGRQSVQGTLSQDDMSLSAQAERSGDVIELRSLRARAQGGEASGSARLRLGEPLGVEADLKLARFDPSRFGDYPQGRLNGSAKGSGSLGASPEGSLAWQFADSTLFGQPFASKGRARISAARISGADAWVSLGANRATAKGSFGGPRDELAWTLSIPELNALRRELGGRVEASGKASGSFARPRLVLSGEARKLALPGGVVLDTVSLEAAGTLDTHSADVRARNADLDVTASLKGGWQGGRWRGELLAFQNAGAYPLVLQAPSALEIGADRVALGRFDARLARGRLAVESLLWEGGRLSSAGTLAGLRALSVLEVLGLHGRFAGDLTLDGEWSMSSAPQLNGRLSLRRGGGDLALAGPPQVPLELSRAALDARFTDGRVAAKLEVASGLGTLQLEGEAAGLSPRSAASYTAKIELKELRLLTEPLWTQVRLAGHVGATLHGTGTLGQPLLNGTVFAEALAVEAPAYGIALGGGRVRAELQGERLRIVEATISGGAGRFSVRGSLPLRLAEGGTALEWQAEKFTLLNRPDMRLVASGNGAASFDGAKLGLAGELRADSGHFEVKAKRLPELDRDVVIAGRRAGAEARGRAPLPIDLDLQLDLGEQLTLRAYGYDGGVTGRLHVVTDAKGNLLAQGRLRALHARFSAYGQDLEVDPGALIFDGPIDQPGLDITAWRRRQQVEAGLHVTGSLETPRVELVSNPPVPDSDKLSWLVLGRAPSSTSGADLAVLQAASGALMGAGGENVPLQRRIASRFGLDELTVRSSSGLATHNSTETTTNVFALGKRLSDKLYLSFEQALGATAEYLVKLDYSLTQRVSVRGQSGTINGVGLFYRYGWD